MLAVLRALMGLHGHGQWWRRRRRGMGVPLGGGIWVAWIVGVLWVRVVLRRIRVGHDGLAAGSSEQMQDVRVGRVGLGPPLCRGVGGVGALCEEGFYDVDMATLDSLDEGGHAGMV